MIYLGVDGGGTKTAFALIDHNRQVIAEHETGTCYHIEVGMDGAKQVLEQGIKALTTKAGCTPEDIKFAFLGLPAYGEDSAQQSAMDDLPSGLLSKNRYRCDNDMVNGWAAAFGGQDGINIVAGTGSIAYGVRQGKSARCGGWGELFSDEGSAYWIACKGLQCFTRMSDGRSRKGPLYDIIKANYKLETDLDITALILTEWQSERSKVAQLSALVYEAATAGDDDAKAIFVEAGKELAQMVNGVRCGLNYSAQEPVAVSYSGGAFKAGQLILEPFTRELAGYSDQFTLHTAQYSPVIGAAIYALKLSSSQ